MNLGHVERRRLKLENKFLLCYEHVFVKDTTGWSILEKAIRKYPERLEKITIKSSTNRTYTVEKFLNSMQTCRTI